MKIVRGKQALLLILMKRGEGDKNGGGNDEWNRKAKITKGVKILRYEWCRKGKKVDLEIWKRDNTSSRDNIKRVSNRKGLLQ